MNQLMQMKKVGDTSSPSLNRRLERSMYKDRLSVPPDKDRIQQTTAWAFCPTSAYVAQQRSSSMSSIEFMTGSHLQRLSQFQVYVGIFSIL
jgi:hypothetical protein